MHLCITWGKKRVAGARCSFGQIGQLIPGDAGKPNPMRRPKFADGAIRADG